MTAKDTPNFIANRIALFGVARILDVPRAGEFTIEEMDAITGPAIGRPKSATFRTMDIAGVDVIAHVAATSASGFQTMIERARFELPDFVGQMMLAARDPVATGDGGRGSGGCGGDPNSTSATAEGEPALE